MAALTDTQKRWIVERLACYEQPSDVADAFKEEYGVEIVRMQVQNYDAAHAYSRKRMSKELVTLFDETRRRFREDTEGIPIAQKTFRLRKLDRMARKAEDMRNYALAASLMEQAAKECGDAFTNKHKHEVTGAGGGPLVVAWPAKAPDAQESGSQAGNTSGEA